VTRHSLLLLNETLSTTNASESYPYKITLGLPAGRSYAERIAARYGIGREQLIELLDKRRVLNPNDPN
jgi:hypothetical protein